MISGRISLAARPSHALAGLDDHGAHGLLLERLEVRRDVALPGSALLLGELFLDGLLQGLDLGDTALLVGIGQGGVHLVVMGDDALLHLGHRLVERVLLRHDGTVDALHSSTNAGWASQKAAMASWPNSMAASMSSSVTSSAPASTMEMKSRVPASSRSRSEFSRSS